MTLLTKHLRFYAKWTTILSAVFLLCGAHIPKTKPKGVKTIVIDPGHGGKDPGCNGNVSNEKDVALAIALKLGDLIEKNLKDVKVIYTRKTDIFVELEERAQIANRNEADLFISIHCNAASIYATYKDKNGKTKYKSYKDKKGRIRKVEIHNPKPYGSATYVMGISNEKGKLNTAKRENAAMLLEDNYKKTYDGFDPESDEAYIVMSLWTGAFVEQSASLASKIQEEYTAKAGRIDKGVQRQSIWVLWRTAMPSILTEVGFLTNPEEEKFLNSDKGQTYMATSLFKATRKYKDEAEGQIKKYDDEFEKLEPLQNENLTKGNKNEEIDVNDSAKVAEAALDEKYKSTLKAAEDSFKLKKYEGAGKLYTICNELRPEEKYPPARVEECKKRLTEVQKKESEEEKQKREGEIKYNDLISSADKLFGQSKWNAAIIQYQLASDVKHDEKYPRQKIKEAEEKAKQDVVKKDTVVTPKNIIDNYKDNTPKTVKSAIVFKVQFAVCDVEPDFKAVKFNSLEDLSFYKAGSSYKITSGNFLKPDDAVNHQNKMRTTGYKDCFVVAFKNGQRIDYKEAVKEFSLSKS
jgi:N-acetylmuramoyl-L-alanine amidase